MVIFKNQGYLKKNDIFTLNFKLQSGIYFVKIESKASLAGDFKLVLFK